jgi:hypothetical protein
MSKTVFLYVYGADFSAIDFEKKYNAQEVYESMLAEGVTHKVLEDTDDAYIEVKIKEFGEVDPEFVTWIMYELCDYDQLKAADIFEVKPV